MITPETIQKIIFDKIEKFINDGNKPQVILMNEIYFKCWIKYLESKTYYHDTSIINTTKRAIIRYHSKNIFIHCSLNMDYSDDLEIY